IINGNSMEPLYHRGDLVIIRAQPDYQVGDIVTYRHPQIGPVIHRIIGRDVERFVFKGDHNNFIDPYRPVRADLIGKSWIYLPSVGNVLSQLRKPLNMAILAAVAGVVIMAPSISIGKQPKARKRGRRPAAAGSPSQRQSGGNHEGLLMALAVLACASIALAAFAFTRPTTHDVSDEITYQQTGTFGYSAAAPAGLFDSNTITTGDPLFPQLTNEATFNFDYQLVADAPSDLHGSYRLLAEVSAANGWQRTVEIRPATAFSGPAFAAGGVLHFAQLRALTDRFEQQTGLLRQQYTLAIVPELAIEGTLAGQALHDTFAPRMEFRLDQTQLQLEGAGGSTQDPLKPSKPGLIKYIHVEPNVISLLFLKLEVPLARWIGVGGLGFALVGLLVLGLLMLRAGRPDQAARIRSKYGALLIDVASSDQRAAARAVAIATIGDLARLAEKSGQMILHEISGAAHRYSVHDGDRTYLYQTADSSRDGVATPTPRPAAVEERVPAPWHSVFLEALREKGTVAEACREAGIGMAAAYEERAHVAAFAQAWNEARSALRASQSSEVNQP
ncbi:MAG TPA: signal peptidase I, partial [Roseiflexaceae bacterium]